MFFAGHILRRDIENILLRDLKTIKGPLIRGDLRIEQVPNLLRELCALFAAQQFADLNKAVSGSFVVEKVFNVPGLGQEFIKSVFNRDYPLILGTVVFFGALIVIFNLVSDVVQLLLDPRSRN